MRSGHGKTYISSGILLPSKVTHLVIKRPPHFYFRPGDYVFVNIPAIAKYEWHPFTLSSAPEQDDYMWLHIRGVGEWTNRLYSYFEKEQARLHNGEIMPSAPNSKTVFKTDMLPLKQLPSATPQKDFLAKNLAQLKHSPIGMRSLDSPTNTRVAKRSSPATIRRENEIEKKENPFNFNVAPKQAISALANQSNAAQPKSTDESKTTNAQRPKFDRQTSESSNSAIRKIQATLQRTFSRKGTSPQEGHSNEGFLNDDEANESELNVCKNRIRFPLRRLNFLAFQSMPRRRLPAPERKINMMKTPLEKSLSMPDMENRLKKRERLIAYVFAQHLLSSVFQFLFVCNTSIPD